MDLGSIDAHELDPSDLQAFLQSYRLLCVSSKKVAGQQHCFFVAEQVMCCPVEVATVQTSVTTM